ncbi:MAG TPA: thiamine ABC transporter substrate-binding protein [Acidimicrobiia bacterium]|nr:thiamine ABC transporter substrate-binding protein [Acidimicrobiia bacterium]
MKRARTASLAFALLIAAAACGSSGGHPAASAPAGSPTTVAPKITTVRLLTHSSFAASKDVLAAFTRETGYKVKLVQPGDAGVMVNEAILRRNDPVADALFGVDNTFLTRALDAGIFEPYVAPGLGSVPAALRVDPQHRVTPIDDSDVCVIDDKSWFGHDGRPPAPTTLDDLTDPRYKNLTVVENAATSSPGLAFLLETIARKGESGWTGYWRALKQNGVHVDDDWTTAYESDFTAGGGGGDRPIVVSYGSDPVADVVGSSPHRDTPKVGVLASTCFRQMEFAGVLHGAHNVAGAQALIDFMLTRRFQDDMPLQMYVNPIVAGAQPPAVYRKWVVDPPGASSIDPAVISAKRNDWIREWTDLVVR